MKRIVQILCLVVLFAVCSTGCKTVQTQERIVYRDSTTVRVVHDTIREIVHDTTHIAVQHSTRTDEGTVIEFAASGGSYNSRTGEASNVQRVHEQKQAEQNTGMQIDRQRMVEVLQAKSDSLQNSLIDLLQQENEVLKQATAPTKWHRFLVWWFWISLLAIVSSVIWWVIKTFYLRR